MAFVGGMISIDAAAYRLLVGGLLLVAAVRMLMVTRAAEEIKAADAEYYLLLGAVLGLASGLTGIGGGSIFKPDTAYFWMVLYAPECGSGRWFYSA